MNFLSLFVYRIALLSLDEAFERVLLLAKSPGFKTVTTLNASMMVEAEDEPWLRKYIESSVLVLADGAGITLACLLKLKQKVTKVAGVELVQRLFEQDKASMFLIGGSEDFIADSLVTIKASYPCCKVLGWHDGYMTKSERKSLCLAVAEGSPDIILVGMGVPIQEKLILELGKVLTHGVAIGVGGSFDVVLGEVKRAPAWMIKCHLEWLYRGLCQPCRLRKWRQLARFCGILFRDFRQS